MKKMVIFFAILSICTFLSCKYDGYKIEGQAPDGAVSVVLSTLEGKLPIPADTVFVDKKGNFTFSGKISEPKMAYLQIDSSQVFASLFLANETYSITKNTDGGYDVNSDGIVQKEYKSISDGLKSCADKYTFMDSVILSNPLSYPAAYILFRKLYPVMELDQVETLLNKFSDSLKSSSTLKILSSLIDCCHNTEIGKPYVNFNSHDIEGNPFTFSDIVDGKSWVFIDFWASWCPYCREENPTLVKAFSLYGTKGIKFLSVSLDSSREEWIKAVKSDNLQWIHVSDLDFWNCIPARLYGVSAIPGNVLISPDGIIVARGLYGENFIDYLEKILN